jgi:hypothetical protein
MADRHFCSAAHEKGAWIVCSAASTTTSLCVYIAVQQEENPLEMPGVFDVELEMTPWPTRVPQ